MFQLLTQRVVRTVALWWRCRRTPWTQQIPARLGFIEHY